MIQEWCFNGHFIESYHTEKGGLVSLPFFVYSYTNYPKICVEGQKRNKCSKASDLQLF